MKIFGVLGVLFGAAMAVLAASAGPASAGEIYPWASAEGCAGCGEYGYAGSWGYAYGAYVDGSGYHGPGCCGRLDYDRYIVGHGPMFPAGDRLIGYSYGPPITPKTLPAANTSPGPNGR